MKLTDATQTQAALLEAMQERWQWRGAPTNYQILCTRHGQILSSRRGHIPGRKRTDRFMFMVTLGYPDRNDEVEILRCTTGGARATLNPYLMPTRWSPCRMWFAAYRKRSCLIMPLI